MSALTTYRTPNYTQAPTSASLNSKTLTEAAFLSLKFNELLLEDPTNLHLNGLWTFTIDGSKVYYATADNILHFVGMHPYFRQLLRYQVSSGIVDFNDPSRYPNLYRQFESLRSDSRFLSIPLPQRNIFLTVLQSVARNSAIPINDIKMEISSDGELAIYRKEDSGTHYILVGDEANDVSYMYLSSTPGIYRSLHATEGINIETIVDSFAS